MSFSKRDLCTSAFRPIATKLSPSGFCWFAKYNSKRKKANLNWWARGCSSWRRVLLGRKNSWNVYLPNPKIALFTHFLKSSSKSCGCHTFGVALTFAACITELLHHQNKSRAYISIAIYRYFALQVSGRDCLTRTIKKRRKCRPPSSRPKKNRCGLLGPTASALATDD